MKALIVSVILTVLMTGSKFIDSESAFQFKDKNKYTIVIHGGVGTISKDMPDSIKQDYLKKKVRCPYCGYKILYKPRTINTKVPAI